ncbi:hypothetical protein WA158_004685 [Blastocystis sp. Blastoise]
MSFSTKTFAHNIETSNKFLLGKNSNAAPMDFVNKRKIYDFFHSLHVPHMNCCCDVVREHFCITTSTGFFEPLYVYRPKDAIEEKLPIIFFCHGGHWCLGNIHEYEQHLIKISRQCHACVVYVDYRKAPEYKFPIPIEDCYNALIALLKNPMKYHIDTEKLILLGECNGGNITANICQRLHAETQWKPILQVLIYPNLDVSPKDPTLIADIPTAGLTYTAIQAYNNYFYKTNDQKRMPEGSPIYFEHFEYFPPTFTMTCEYDYVTEGALIFNENLKLANVPVKHSLIRGGKP